MLDEQIINKEMKFITSYDVELEHAEEYVKSKADEIEKEGVWIKYGKMTTISNENTGAIVFIQAMIKA